MYENRIEVGGDFLRDRLDLASRDELFAYAQANGVTEIDNKMYLGAYAGEKMKKILRSKGLVSLDVKISAFEAPKTHSLPVTSNVDSLINTPQAPLDPRTDAKVMSRAELAKECKRRGIKMERTDTKEKLQERLSVQDAA